ncbi:hypothetical protein Dimus_019340 [Dionaea muscipula]
MGLPVQAAFGLSIPRAVHCLNLVLARGDATIVGLLMAALAEFASASGLHINQDKSSLLCASMDEQGVDLLKSITGF